MKEDVYYANPYALAGKIGMHPFVFQKTMQQVNLFTFEELNKIYRKIFQVDLEIKTGKVEPTAALDLLILNAKP